MEKSLYQKPGKSQHEWEKMINRGQHQYESDVEINWQDFKAPIIKMFQQAIKNSLETKILKKNLI